MVDRNMVQHEGKGSEGNNDTPLRWACLCHMDHMRRMVSTYMEYMASLACLERPYEVVL